MMLAEGAASLVCRVGVLNTWREIRAIMLDETETLTFDRPLLMALARPLIGMASSYNADAHDSCVHLPPVL